jgi:hypothetical protein
MFVDSVDCSLDLKHTAAACAHVGSRRAVKTSINCYEDIYRLLELSAAPGQKLWSTTPLKTSLLEIISEHPI